MSEPIQFLKMPSPYNLPLGEEMMPTLRLIPVDEGKNAIRLPILRWKMVQIKWEFYLFSAG